MNQSGFSLNFFESFELQYRSQTPLSTPYCSGMPIDAIAVADKDNESPAQKPCTAAYQSLVVSVGWLCNNTRPNLSVVHSFLFSYLIHPASGHTKAALYVLQCIHSMGELVPDMVNQQLKRQLLVSSSDSLRFGSTSLRGCSSKQHPAEVIWMDAIFLMAYTNAS